MNGSRNHTIIPKTVHFYENLTKIEFFLIAFGFKLNIINASYHLGVSYNKFDKTDIYKENHSNLAYLSFGKLFTY